MKNKILFLLLIITLVAITFMGCNNLNETQKINEKQKINETQKISETGQIKAIKIDKEGRYSKPQEVSEYIRTYQKLPKNFITKKEATILGWDSSKGNLWEVTDKMSIGGDIFGNREGRLPKAQGRKWFECDINYFGGFRGGERIIYSSDGLIYYTKDHYETFSEISFKAR